MAHLDVVDGNKADRDGPYHNRSCAGHPRRRSVIHIPLVQSILQVSYKDFVSIPQRHIVFSEKLSFNMARRPTDNVTFRVENELIHANKEVGANR